jgi:hypothetical protein
LGDLYYNFVVEVHVKVKGKYLMEKNNFDDILLGFDFMFSIFRCFIKNFAFIMALITKLMRVKTQLGGQNGLSQLQFLWTITWKYHINSYLTLII